LKSAKLIASLMFSFLMVFQVWAGDTIWELQAVNEDGAGSHPKVGAAPEEPNKVVVEGISLASTGEIDVPDSPDFAWFSLWLQADAPRGGIQVWSGPWNLAIWQDWSVQAGDVVRVEGWVANHNGKVFVNDRHSVPIMWNMEVLSHGAMPDPEVIPSIAVCNHFDVTRETGGERYQTRWVRINGVQIVSGEWGAGNELIITDSSGEELIMLLASPGNFDAITAPMGAFDVVGIFDQEDPELPYHENYRIWVKNSEGIVLPSAVQFWDLYQ